MDSLKTDRRKPEDKILDYKLRRMRQTLSGVGEYKDIFSFYEKVLRLRHEYAALLREVLDPAEGNGAKASARLGQGLPLIDKNDIRLDLECMKSHFAALFELISANSPLVPRSIGDVLQSNPGRPLRDIIDAIRRQPECPVEIVQFLFNETVNPLLEIHAEKYRDEKAFDGWNKGRCPVCGGAPMLGVILPDGGRRELVCADCCTAWDFPRLKCPFCDNENQETLSYLRIDRNEDCRIEVCHSCRHYLKTLTPSALPRFPVYDVENLATIHLDMIAGRQGYISAALESRVLG